MKTEIRVGDKQQTSISDSWGLAAVIKVEEVNTETSSGVLVYHRYEDVGYDTQAVFMEDGAILGPRLDERMRRSGIPPEYAYCMGSSVDWGRYGGEDTAPQKKIVNAFVQNFEAFRREGRGLYLYSQMKGSGKTMIACSVANEILKRLDVSVKFINEADYIEVVKAKDDGSRQRQKAIFEAGLLILDDIGTQDAGRDWVETALFRLIDRRYTNHLPTIFTSNVKIEDLKMDSRISDRIYAVSVPVIMPEVNVRNQIADKHTKEFLKGILS